MKGDRGESGPQGHKGHTGLQGMPGPIGSRGEKGEKVRIFYKIYRSESKKRICTNKQNIQIKYFCCGFSSKGYSRKRWFDGKTR